MATPDAELSNFGEVFTRPWVAAAILDLVGYSATTDLGIKTIVEPSCGSGAFLVPIVERLLASAIRRGTCFEDMGSCVRAYDLQQDNVDLARKHVLEVLLAAGCTRETADRLVTTWIRRANFLLDNESISADFVVGNPPYVRPEQIPSALLSQYRAASTTMRGRADIYIGFIERMLRLLGPTGRAGFICADRWMRNEYGEALRKFIAGSYSVDHLWSMHDVDAFEAEVAAYPAITVLRRGEQGPVALADADRSFGAIESQLLVTWALSNKADADEPGFRAFRSESWPVGGSPWPTGSVGRLRMLAAIQQSFPPLQDASSGTRISIGVATGRDDVFIRSEAPVEPERLLPLIMAEDLASGGFKWGGSYLVNPWDEKGLVELKAWPRLARYFKRHKPALLKRHVARKTPKRWYRTIDRVNFDVTTRSKLVLPELKSTIHPVLAPAGFYPHHNLYYVVSDSWDLEVLGGLLLSRVAQAFVEAYCVRMRNDTLRFQAQYLRRIHVPRESDLSPELKYALRSAFRTRDVEAATLAALQAYGLDHLPE